MDSNSESKDGNPGAAGSNDNKDDSTRAWTHCSMELFEAYLEYQLQHGNAEMSTDKHRTHVEDQHKYRQAFPKPIMSYYPYIFAAASHIPMPRLSPTLSETDRASPFGSRLVFKIEEVIGNGSGSASTSGSDTSSENGSTDNGSGGDNGDGKQPKHAEPAQHEEHGADSDTGVSHAAAGASGTDFTETKPDALHSFANFIAEFSAKHGITTDEAMAQMMYATELYQVEQHLLRDITEKIGGVTVNINNEVLEELTPPGLESESIQLATEGPAGTETSGIVVDIAVNGTGTPLQHNQHEGQSAALNQLNESSDNLLESTTEAETVTILEPEPEAEFKVVLNDSEVIEKVYNHEIPTFSPPCTTTYTFRAPLLPQGYRTGTYCMTPEQRSYNSMRTTRYSPNLYYSQHYTDQFGYYPPPAFRYGPPHASTALNNYQPPMPPSIQEIALGFGGSFPPQMQMASPFIASGPVIETNKKGICPFCRRNGEDESVYKSHNLYQPGTRKVICPVLRRFKCELCGASGDFAHTRGYCRYNDPNYVPTPSPPAAFQ